MSKSSNTAVGILAELAEKRDEIARTIGETSRDVA